MDMSDIGLKLSIPPGAIPGDQSLPFSVRPAAGGNIDMPANCVPHSPLYLIPSLLMQERVKITIEHSCSIQSEEDRDRMVFLGVDTSQQQVGGGYKLKEVEDVEVEFEIGDQKGCIYLKEVQSLRIGRRTDSSPGTVGKGSPLTHWWEGKSKISGEGRSERREGRCPLTHWWVQWGGEIREGGGRCPLTHWWVQWGGEIREGGGGRCPLTHWWVQWGGEIREGGGKVPTDSLVGTVGRGDQRGGGGGRCPLTHWWVQWGGKIRGGGGGRCPLTRWWVQWGGEIREGGGGEGAH